MKDVEMLYRLFGLLLLILLGCKSEPQPLVTSTPQITGLHLCDYKLKDGTEVRYSIYVPPKHESSDEALPLAMALHFGGEVTPFYGKGIINSLVKGGLDKIDPIIVAPDCLGGRGWTNEKNEVMVLEIYDHIIANYRVDTQRTVITGFSMGGHGTWHIAGRNQDRFKAAIPVAGHPNESIEAWTIPVMAIHSHADEIVPIDPTLKYVKRMQENGSPMSITEIQKTPHYQTAAFRAPMRGVQDWLKSAWENGSNVQPETEPEK